MRRRPRTPTASKTSPTPSPSSQSSPRHALLSLHFPSLPSSFHHYNHQPHLTTTPPPAPTRNSTRTPTQGLDVNVQFTRGIQGFEFTAETAIFDLLRCPLVHGWLADPADTEAHAVLQGLSYNQLAELLITQRLDPGRESVAEARSLSAAAAAAAFLALRRTPRRAAPHPHA